MRVAPGPTPAPPQPRPEPSPPDVVPVGGTVADEVVGFVQRLLPEVAGAIGVLRDHKHVILGHRGLSPPRGPRRGPGSGSVSEPHIRDTAAGNLCDWPVSAGQLRLGCGITQQPWPQQGWRVPGAQLGCSGERLAVDAPQSTGSARRRLSTYLSSLQAPDIPWEGCPRYQGPGGWWATPWLSEPPGTSRGRPGGPQRLLPWHPAWHWAEPGRAHPADQWDVTGVKMAGP